MIKHSDDIPIVRGCGRRDPGGIYLVSKLGNVGYPWWYWLSDPPVPIPPPAFEHLRLNDLGSQVIQRQPSDVHDVWDIVGQGRTPSPQKGKGYWNVLDYAIEVNYAGASRKIAPSLPIQLLSPESRLVLLHRRACILNWRDYLKVIGNGSGDDATNHSGEVNEVKVHSDWTCVRGLPPHMTPTEPLDEQCAGLWFHDVEGGELPNVEGDAEHGTWGGVSTQPTRVPHLTPVVRRMPAFTYNAWTRPSGVTPAYELGIFMLLPINGVEVIKDTQHSKHEDALKAAQRGPFEVTPCEA